LDIALSKISFNEPFIPTVMNVDAEYVAKDSVKKQLSNQIDNPVLFLNQLQRLEKDINPDKWMHIGPGDVTSGMAKRSISSKEVGVVNSLKSLN
jgi:malonyl CoA-acyl carrier protein transacylase